MKGNTLITLAMSMMLMAMFTKAQDGLKWQNLGVSIEYARTHNFVLENQLSLIDWEGFSNYNTFRVGLTYDSFKQRKWNYNYGLHIDWLLNRQVIRYNDPDFGNDRLASMTNYGGQIYFIADFELLYTVFKNTYVSISPHINVFMYSDVGEGYSRGTAGTYSFEFESIERNRIIRPSLSFGVHYEFKSKIKWRVGAFYEYSLSPITFGEYNYMNSNGVMETGSWKQRGHRAGIGIKIFPFK